MKVSIEIVAKMNPCKERFDNFKNNYSNFDSDFETFLSLDKITYDDKIWVSRCLLNKNQLVHFAVLCAQSVLIIYENKFPNDTGIRECLNYLTTITDFSNLSISQLETLKNHRKAAYAAYADAADTAYAAYAAAYDAAAAYAAAYDAAAAYAAAAAAAYAAYAAAAAAYDADAAYAADARKTQQDLNLKFLLIASKL